MKVAASHAALLLRARVGSSVASPTGEWWLCWIRAWLLRAMAPF